MRRTIVVILVLAVVGGIWAGRDEANGQGGTPIATPNAFRAQTLKADTYLPRPSDFGDGWTTHVRSFPPVDGSIFVASATAVYLGPGGTRVYIAVYLVRQGRAAIQRSWSDVGAVYEDYRNDLLRDNVNQDLSIRSLPDGCVDIRHVQGTDVVWDLPMGITMCAIDPNAIVVTAVNGRLGRLAGAAASDAVAELAYSASLAG